MKLAHTIFYMDYRVRESWLGAEKWRTKEADSEGQLKTIQLEMYVQSFFVQSVTCVL